MPQPLREPFFLWGRTSVVQRAVIMSVVLGGLTGAAGWLVGLSVWLMLHLDRVTHFDQIFCVSWAIAVTALVYAPLNYWNRRSVLWTLATLPATYITVFLAHLLFDKSGPENAAIKATISFVGVALVTGLLQLRSRKLHRVAYATSVLGAAVPILLVFGLGRAVLMQTLGLSENLAVVIQLAMMVGGWLCSLAIPWGIPFWWPQEQEAAEEAHAVP